MAASNVSPGIITNCVDSSFVNLDGNQDINKAVDNHLLREETDIFLQRGVIVWPAVMINNITYRVNNKFIFFK